MHLFHDIHRVGWVKICLFLFLFSPSLCMGHPHVFIDFSPHLQIDDESLQGIDVVWEFDRFSSEMMIEDIDPNKNGKIDSEEMEFFDENYRSIEKEANFFLSLYYKKRVFDDFDATLKQVSIENNQVRYDIEIKFQKPLIPDEKKSLLVEFADPEMFVAFLLKKNPQRKSDQNDSRIRYNPLVRRETCFSVDFFPISKAPLAEEGNSVEAVQQQPTVETAPAAPASEPLLKRLRTMLYTVQGKYNRKLGDLIMSMKEKFSLRVIAALFFFSLLYGILHALGPGHGKSVVIGFFLQRKASFFQILYIASGISIIHTWSALLLAFLFQTYLDSFTSLQRIRIQSNLSFMIACFILLAGVFMLVQLIRKKISREELKSEANLSAPKWIFAAGFIPCPLSITIMLVSVTHNILFLGLISVISISVGMMIVLTAAGLIAKAAKSRIQRYSSQRWGAASKLHDVLEFCGAILIIVFGLGLILIYMPRFS